MHNRAKLGRERGTDVEDGQALSTPWLTVREAAGRARCGPKLIYREVRAGRLRAARVGGRRELRLLAEWVDDWLLRMTTPQAVHPVVSLRGRIDR